MKIAIDILKSIVLPKLEKDLRFDVQKTNVDFWEKFANNLLHFEEDAKPLYAIIYSLELDNSEKIIGKLPNIYPQFIKHLAESYVLEQTSEATDYLLKTSNATFLKDVRFLETMQKAIKNVERKRIKADLPKSYERLTFELSDADLANVARKKGREDLKEKMKQWDEELVEEDDMAAVYSMLTDENKNKKEAKVVSLSLLKYYVAASIIIATGIFYFKNTDPSIVPAENSVVKTTDKKETTQPQTNLPTAEAIVLAPIETTLRTITVLQPESLGFTSDKKEKIIINFKDGTKRILSLEKFLDNTTTNSTVDTKILDQYITELADLKTKGEKYSFDGKTLTIFSNYDPKKYEILSTEDMQYFLKRESNYYNVKIARKFLPLEKVSDEQTIDNLDKITFDNGR